MMSTKSAPDCRPSRRPPPKVQSRAMGSVLGRFERLIPGLLEEERVFGPCAAIGHGNSRLLRAALGRGRSPRRRPYPGAGRTTDRTRHSLRLRPQTSAMRRLSPKPCRRRRSTRPPATERPCRRRLFWLRKAQWSPGAPAKQKRRSYRAGRPLSRPARGRRPTQAGSGQKQTKYELEPHDRDSEFAKQSESNLYADRRREAFRIVASSFAHPFPARP